MSMRAAPRQSELFRLRWLGDLDDGQIGIDQHRYPRMWPDQPHGKHRNQDIHGLCTISHEIIFVVVINNQLKW